LRNGWVAGLTLRAHFLRRGRGTPKGGNGGTTFGPTKGGNKKTNLSRGPKKNLKLPGITGETLG